MQASPLRIVIVGGGSAGWMCAAACAQVLHPARYSLTLIESDDIGTVGVGEATLPALRDFNELLQDRRGAVHARDAGHVQARHRVSRLESARAKATFIPSAHSASSGVAWSSSTSGCARASRDSIRRHSTNFPARCAPARAMPSNFPTRTPCAPRFMATPIISMPASTPNSCATGPRARGVTRIEGQVVDVALESTQGDIQSLTLKSGQQIAGDFFVDCSGFRSLLLGDKLGSSLGRLDSLAALRSRLGGALRTLRRLHAVHAIHGAEGRLDLAHSAAAPHRQRSCVLDAVRQRRRSARHAAGGRSTPRRWASRAC